MSDHGIKVRLDAVRDSRFVIRMRFVESIDKQIRRCIYHLCQFASKTFFDEIKERESLQIKLCWFVYRAALYK